MNIKGITLSKGDNILTSNKTQGFKYPYIFGNFKKFLKLYFLNISI